jgi:type IV secretory pathway VirB10-like protein
LAGVVVLALLSLDACLKRKQPAATAPPPAPIVLPQKPPVEQKQPQISPPADANGKSSPPQSPKALEIPPELPGPPVPPKRTRRARTKTPSPSPAQQQPAQPAPSAPITTAAEPQLAPMLSEEQKRIYATAITELVVKAERNLSAAEARNPNQQQREMIQQAKTFLAQAQDIRTRDLAAAKSLADRAEILSREVLAEFK